MVDGSMSRVLINSFFIGYDILRYRLIYMRFSCSLLLLGCLTISSPAPPHSEIMDAVAGNKRGRTSAAADDGMDLSKEASQSFEKEGVRKVSRNEENVRVLKDEEEIRLPPAAVRSSDKITEEEVNQASAESAAVSVKRVPVDESWHAIVNRKVVEPIVTAKIITSAHSKVFRNLVFSPSDTVDAVYSLATEAFKSRNLVPLCYSSFLGLYFGAGSLSRYLSNERSVEAPPVKEKRVNFSIAHREIMLEFIHKAENTSEERELLFKEVSKEFEKRGIDKISKQTFMRHFKGIAADLFQKEAALITSEEEVADAVGALLFLRDREA